MLYDTTKAAACLCPRKNLREKLRYEDFSGTELLFGGTTLDRAAGNTVELTCSLDIEEGEAAVFLCSGLEEPMILLSESGDYSSTIEVGGGSTYIGVWGEGVAGSVSIQIE